MKRLFTLTVALLSLTTLFAQQPYKVYCTLMARQSEISTLAISRITIDYGQEELTKNYLADINGKAEQFTTITAVANRLAKYGWEFEDSYTIGDDRCVWIMSKIVTDDSQITEGITTRWILENCGPHQIP